MNIIKNDPFVNDLPEKAMTMLQTVVDTLGYHHDVFLFHTIHGYLARFKKPDEQYNPHFAGLPGRVRTEDLLFLAQLEGVKWVESAIDCLVIHFELVDSITSHTRPDTLGQPCDTFTDTTQPVTQIVCVSEYRDQISHLERLWRVDRLAIRFPSERSHWRQRAARAMKALTSMDCASAKPKDRQKATAILALVQSHLNTSH